MVGMSKKLAKGNLDITVEVKSQDEFGELAASFSDMINTIKGLAKVLGNIEKGNLDVVTTQNYEGNFIGMKTSIENIIISLNSVFKEIREASSQVNGGAEQVSATAQDLSEGAAEQTGSIEELSSFIQQVSEQVHANARNADTANNLSMNLIKDSRRRKNLADSAANNLSKVVSEVKKSTEVIIEITEVSEGQAKSIEKMSKRVVKIIR